MKSSKHPKNCVFWHSVILFVKIKTTVKNIVGGGGNLCTDYILLFFLPPYFL